MAVGRLRIVRESYADQGTITASSESRPVANLRDARRGAVWRSTDTADQILTGDFSVPRRINAAVIWRHNLSTASTWRLRLWSGPNQSADLVYDSGLRSAVPRKTLGDLDWGVDPLGASIFDGWPTAFSNIWVPGLIARSWQIDFSDPGQSAGHLQITRLYLGATLSPQRNFEFGGQITWDDRSEQQRTDGGSIRVFAREPTRRLAVDLTQLRPLERAAWLELARAVGLRRDIFVSAYPEAGGSLERDYAFAARLAKSVGMTRRRAQAWRAPLEFIET